MPMGKNGRRPYLPVMKRDWWMQQRYFRMYMLREATVLPLLFFVGCLISGFYCLAVSEAHWFSWQGFMAEPWVMMLNGLALAASIFHAKTFFELFPRVMPLAPASVMIAAQWAAMLVVASVIGLLLMGAGA